MKIQLIAFFILFIAGFQTAWCQVESPDLQAIEEIEQHSDTLAFTLTPFNNISIPAIFNSTDTLNLMFHLAQGASISLIETATAKARSLNFDQKVDDVNSWGGKTDSRFSEKNSLALGPFQWDDLTIYEDKHSGKLTDGKFGPYLFKDKVLEIDFDKDQLIVHTQLPEDLSAYQAFDLNTNRGMLFLKADLDLDKEEVLTQEFLIHSGYSGALLLDDEFVSKNKISDKVQVYSESQLLDSHGNVIKTKKAILPEFTIGKSSFEKVPIGFFEGKIGRQRMSVMGVDLIKRLNWLIDLKNEKVYLKQNVIYDTPYFDSESK